MGRHALSAADDRRPTDTPVRRADTAPDAPLRPRVRRPAAAPLVARSTYVEHRKPARIIAMPQHRAALATVAGPALPTAARTGRAKDPRHVRRTATMQRAALLIAPALAVTSSLTLSIPAEAAPADTTTSATTTASAGGQAQTFTVARGVRVPVTDRGTTSIVSYPTLVVSGGATVGETQAALSEVLSAGGDRATIVQTALQYLGDPYVEGGASHTGIDCSGLTMVAYQAVGIQLDHYVPTQDAVATTIPESEAKAGDLVVYDNGDHVGLYLGYGLVLQAPHPGEPVDVIPMFPAAHHFARLLPAGS